MFSLIIWALGLALESLLVVRALTGTFMRKYALFYTYVSTVLVLSSVRLVVYLTRPTYYQAFYWYSQPLTVMIGCAVLWEIYRQALGAYPGAARMARNVLLPSLLLAFSKYAVNAWNTSSWWQAQTTAELERDIRAIQAILLVGLIVVIAYYAVPLGKNVKGMILGYGFFIGTSLVNLSFRVFLGNSFQKWWQYLQPMFYLTVLSIWCSTLWSYQPVPKCETEPEIEEDYQLLAASSRKRLLQVRAYLGRAIRP